MKNIAELNDCKIITEILNKSFLFIAEEFNFTKENAPNHLAFINYDKIDHWLKNGLKMYGYTIDDRIISCIGYSHIKEREYLIERLAVLPEYRNSGIGKSMMKYIESIIKNAGGEIVEIHAMDKNINLRNWYKNKATRKKN